VPVGSLVGELVRGLSPASYIVYTDGRRYYAKNGSTGAIELVDSDAAKVIQYAIDKMPLPGGTIFLRAGKYYLSKNIRITKFVNLVGEGVRATELILAPNANSPMITYCIPSSLFTSVAQLMMIAHMKIDGNKSNQTSGTAAIVTRENPDDPACAQVADLLVFDVWIANYKGDGIQIIDTHDFVISHVAIELCDGWTVKIVSSNKPVDSTVWKPNGVIEAGYLLGNYGGVYLFYNASTGHALKLIGNEIYPSQWEAIRVEGASSGLYSPVIAVGNRISMSNVNYDAIYLKNARYCLFIGNILFVTNSRYVFNEDIGCDENVFAYNYTSPSQTAPYIKKSGARTVVVSELYIRTRNSGVAMILTGSTRVTVSHGLIQAPSKVLITPLAQPPGKLWVENITSTSFDIVTDTAPTADLKVSWQAEV